MGIFQRPQMRTPRTEPAARRRLPRRALLPTRTLVIAGAIITALTVLFLAAGRVQRSPRSTGEVVFVTMTQIPARAPIVPQVVQLQRVPPDRLPKGAVRSPEQLASRVAKRPIPAGEILTEDMLASVEEEFGVASLLSEGMQAFTVVLPEVDAAMGRIVSGNRVDVLATFQQPAPATRVVAREALVIGVQQVEIQLPAQGAPSGPQNQGGGTAKLVAVTLQVPSSAVPGLVLGQHAGRLALVVYPSKGEIAPGEVEGASIPLLVKGFLPEENTRGQPQQPQQQAVPPPPKSYPSPPPPPPPPQVPSEHVVKQEESKPAAAEEKKPAPPPQAVIEVIRGSSVRAEVVPVGTAAPTGESAKSRTREGVSPVLPAAAPPGQGGSEGPVQVPVLPGEGGQP